MHSVFGATLARETSSRQIYPECPVLLCCFQHFLLSCSLNERGLFDYLLLNDDLDNTAAELARIAERAYQGLPAEPGQVPDEVRFEEDADEATADSIEQQLGGSPNSNAAAAAAAGIQAAAALPSVITHKLTSSPQPAPAESPEPAQEASSTTASAAAAAPQQTAAEVPEQPQQVQPQQTEALPEPQQQQPAGPSGASAGAAVAAGLDAWRGKVALVSSSGL